MGWTVLGSTKTNEHFLDLHGRGTRHIPTRVRALVCCAHCRPESCGEAAFSDAEGTTVDAGPILRYQSIRQNHESIFSVDRRNGRVSFTQLPGLYTIRRCHRIGRGSCFNRQSVAPSRQRSVCDVNDVVGVLFPAIRAGNQEAAGDFL